MPQPALIVLTALALLTSSCSGFTTRTTRPLAAPRIVRRRLSGPLSGGRAWRSLPTASLDPYGEARVQGQPKGRLVKSDLSPQPPSVVEGVVKWSLFAGVLAAISFGFEAASTSEFVRSAAPAMSPANWELLSKLYPGVAVVGTLFNFALYQGQGSGGATVAEAMGGMESDDPALAQMVRQVHAQSGLEGESPRVFMVPSEEPNAFAAGTGASVVAVTSGLVDLLTADEVQAVVAHEVGHVRNKDMGRSLQTAAMLGGLGALMSVGDLLTRFDRPDYDVDDNEDDAPPSLYAVGWMLYVTGALSYAFGFLVRAGNSRTREFEADAFAKSIGAGSDLASALRKLDEYGKGNKVERQNGVGLGLARGAFASSYIDNPPSRESPFINLGGLLRSHPTTEERIARLLDDETL